MGWIVFLLPFYKDGFGFKLPTKFDMPLIKEIELEPYFLSYGLYTITDVLQLNSF